jgi:hypothetical protein
MTIIEGNKLIAEFMGWEKSPYPNTPDKLYRDDDKNEKQLSIHVSQLLYHSSWDWQIPAWIKLLSITRERYYNEIKSGRSTSWSDQRDVWESNYHSAIDSGLPE